MALRVVVVVVVVVVVGFPKVPAGPFLALFTTF